MRFFVYPVVVYFVDKLEETRNYADESFSLAIAGDVELKPWKPRASFVSTGRTC